MERKITAAFNPTPKFPFRCPEFLANMLNGRLQCFWRDLFPVWRLVGIAFKPLPRFSKRCHAFCYRAHELVIFHSCGNHLSGHVKWSQGQLKGVVSRQSNRLLVKSLLMISEVQAPDALHLICGKTSSGRSRSCSA